MKTGRNLRERGRRRIQTAVPAVPNSLDLESSRKIPQLPDPVPAVPGVFKEATKPPAVKNKIDTNVALKLKQKHLSLDVNSQGKGFRISQVVDSVRRRQNGFVRDSGHGPVIKNRRNSQTSGTWSNRGLASFPNGALVPQEEPKARAKILALLAQENNKVLLAEEGQSSKHNIGLDPFLQG